MTPQREERRAVSMTQEVSASFARPLSTHLPPAPPPVRQGLGWAGLLGLAVGMAGIGFGAFVYAVPYTSLSRELKRRSGELLAEKTEASVKGRELAELKRDLQQTRGVSGLRETEDQGWRSDLRFLAAKLEQQTKGSGARVRLDDRGLRIAFPEDVVFDGRGPWFSKTGQGHLDLIAQTVAARAGRILVVAPMGEARPPRWVAPTLPNPSDLSLARVKNVVALLRKAGAPPGVVWGVMGGVPSLGSGAAPTLELEIEPKR